MTLKKIWRNLIVCIVAVGCIGTTSAASMDNDEVMYLEALNCSMVDTVTKEYPMARASGSLDVRISSNTIIGINEDFTLVANDLVTYDCSYTPSSASVDFGVIAPDGLFYCLNVTSGSINKSIRVSQRGTYTLAIRNNSSGTVHVTGTERY